jgi:hypothetical protein
MGHTQGRGGRTRRRHGVLPVIAATIVLGELAWVMFHHV